MSVIKKSTFLILVFLIVPIGLLAFTSITVLPTQTANVDEAFVIELQGLISPEDIRTQIYYPNTLHFASFECFWGDSPCSDSLTPSDEDGMFEVGDVAVNGVYTILHFDKLIGTDDFEACTQQGGRGVYTDPACDISNDYVLKIDQVFVGVSPPPLLGIQPVIETASAVILAGVPLVLIILGVLIALMFVFRYVKQYIARK